MLAMVLGALGDGMVGPEPQSRSRAAGAPFTRTVEPLDPANRPATPPAFDLTAACVRPVRRRQLEAVFGYENPGSQSMLVSLEAGPRTGRTAT